MVVKGILSNTSQGEGRFEGTKIMSESQLAATLSAGLGSVADKTLAMRQILSRTFEKEDMSKMFADVLRGSATCSEERFKRMTHIYFSEHCGSNQELTLLCVHLLRKDCVDRSPITRSSALRILSYPKLAELSQNLPDCVHRASMDSSGVVRRAAAACCVRSHSCFPTPGLSVQEITPHFARLLDSQDLSVISASLQSIESVPDVDFQNILHAKYRRFVGCFGGLDDPGKIAACELFAAYARENFAGPLYPSSDFELLEAALALELSACNSPAVIASILKTKIAIGRKPDCETVSRALAACGCSEEISANLLHALLPMACELRQIISRFFLYSSDSSEVKKIKLKILTCLVNDENASEILRELQVYLKLQSKIYP